MSYDTLETSQQDSQPVLLFKFIQGANAWYYWAGAAPFLYSGNWYQSEPMLPGNFANTGTVPKDKLSVQLPISNALAASFLAYAADAVTTLTVFRLHVDNSEVRTEWKGRVLSHKADLGVLTFTCESVFTSLRRIGVRQTYQRLCRHVLGGPGCNVTLASFTTTQTVVSLDGAQVNFSAALPVDYKGGLLTAPDGTKRMISNVGADYVVLMRPVQSLAANMLLHPAGFTVSLTQGCDRSTAMCSSRFNNLGCFGGWPGIPWINPMTNISSVF